LSPSFCLSLHPHYHPLSLPSPSDIYKTRQVVTSFRVLLTCIFLGTENSRAENSGSQFSLTFAYFVIERFYVQKIILKHKLLLVLDHHLSN
jgi:hypothetical protein